MSSESIGTTGGGCELKKGAIGDESGMIANVANTHALSLALHGASLSALKKKKKKKKKNFARLSKVEVHAELEQPCTQHTERLPPHGEVAVLRQDGRRELSALQRSTLTCSSSATNIATICQPGKST